MHTIFGLLIMLCRTLELLMLKLRMLLGHCPCHGRGVRQQGLGRPSMLPLSVKCSLKLQLLLHAVSGLVAWPRHQAHFRPGLASVYAA